MLHPAHMVFYIVQKSSQYIVNNNNQISNPTFNENHVAYNLLVYDSITQAPEFQNSYCRAEQ